MPNLSSTFKHLFSGFGPLVPGDAVNKHPAVPPHCPCRCSPHSPPKRLDLSWGGHVFSYCMAASAVPPAPAARSSSERFCWRILARLLRLLPLLRRALRSPQQLARELGLLPISPPYPSPPLYQSWVVSDVNVFSQLAAESQQVVQQIHCNPRQLLSSQSKPWAARHSA